MKSFVFVTTLGLTTPALAAWSSYQESARVLKTVLASQQLASKLDTTKTITSIRLTGDGYRISTANRCSVDVKIIYLLNPRDPMGLTPFYWRVSEPTCR